MARDKFYRLLQCFAIGWILTIAIKFRVNGEMGVVLQQCCSVGSTWGTNNTTCTGPPFPVPGIPSEDRTTCLTAIYICCIRIHRHLHCERGKQNARAGHLCSLLPTQGGETYKDCCDGCSLGLKAGSRRESCTLSSNVAFGPPWDEAFTECCISTVSNQEALPFARKANSRCDRESPCSQICNEVGRNIECSCYAGFKLSSDQRTCIDLNECELGTHSCNLETETCLNSVGGFHCIEKYISPQKPSNLIPGDCRPGFVWSHEKQTCDDIDECTLGVCPADRLCTNTIGSYVCAVRNPADICPPGFRKSPTVNTCIDIDECAEGTATCDATQELCLNSHGSYYCQPKSTRAKDCPAGLKWSDTEARCEDVDECAERKHTCNEETQNCENTAGSYRCVSKGATCPHGYKQNISTNECEDINECTEGTDDCNSNEEYCVNTLGSYQCQQKAPVPRCGTGYKYEEGLCKDINECEDGTDSCNKESEVCHNSEGSFSCVPISVTHSALELTAAATQPTRILSRTRRPRYRVRPASPKCSAGFIYNQASRSCVDINECEETQPCTSEQTCENTEGSYRCLCHQGFALDYASKNCRDVNECQLGLHSCAPSQRCDNTIGSYACVRTTSCGTGYTLNAHTNDCEDDDECALGSHNCGPGFVCRNTEGSFRCDRISCQLGQKLLPDGTCQVISCSIGMEPDISGNCRDVNECARGNICRANQRCINTFGSYRCQNLINCGGGYELNENGNQCVDIDECAQRTHECNPQQTCRNIPGGYTCECPPGYTTNNERQCEDIDECTRYRTQVCSITSECQNTQGSYICNCKEGFQKAIDGKNCIDVDECTERPHICQQTCINVWGSYQCACHQGYTLASDGRTCQDIDECSIWEGRGSLCIGICVNEPGSYSCSCPEGYRLGPDKRTCEDIDECEEQNTCKGDNEVCLNTRGSFKCNVINCPHNYVRDREHRNRCKKASLECAIGDEVCRNEPMSYSYNYLSFVSNIKIPVTGMIDLFTMRGPRFTFTTVQFTLDMKSSRAPEGIPPATRKYFHLRRTAFNEAVVSLIKTIPGPQEIELELLMKMYHNGLFGGTAVSKIFLFVTMNEF